MTLPNFLIIGAQKAGTTWLVDKLEQHPQVFLADDEVHFFDKPHNFNQGLNWYQSHFSGSENYLAIGEKTPEYMFKKHIHSVIADYLPHLKSIAVLRNPVTRALSHLNHLFRSGVCSPHQNIDELIFDPKSTIIERGFYYQHLTNYYQFFKPEDVLILINEEDIAIDPSIALTKTCKFLEIDPQFNFENANRKTHKHDQSFLGMSLAYYLPSSVRPTIMKLDRLLPHKTYSLSVSQATREKLYKVYEQENQNLFNLLGRQIDAWNAPENALLN
ncbi:sulfotransferase domain-containing protein [Crocosphaera sp. UHCC 0190]|uniref:sulfotransferase domain-containing protein n=1 Tax=Crocosphaera sp. UHCC 0190 TaxID=3110246 RepID=UPI002B1F72AB|nr:sulfotransferase domain-containing protein [Crocosphaera sp. UHCC 0190]MEA5511114.1 sulfotransferase domain-containing protein [Crocosphaera sp. UHCC 0190]